MWGNESVFRLDTLVVAVQLLGCITWSLLRIILVVLNDPLAL